MSPFTMKQTTKSRLAQIDIERLGAQDFGKYHTDHFARMEYVDGAWGSFEVLPFQDVAISPFLSALHYGQSIFEGMKAYRLANGEIATFRIKEHAQRMNVSAERLAMPTLPEAYFKEAVETLVRIDKNWIPKSEGSSLYIRPLMFASDACLIAKASKNYSFWVMACPVGAYYSKALKVRIEPHFTRAAVGGTGMAKASGNYAASFLAANKAASEGFDQIIWTDGSRHEEIQEMGASNIMFVIENTLVTPDLNDKTILEGITRKSVIELMKHEGIKVVEQKIQTHDLIRAHKQGQLQEAFGLGTAATATSIASITCEGEELIPTDKAYTYAERIKKTLSEIRYGHRKDHFGWMNVVS